MKRGYLLLQMAFLAVCIASTNVLQAQDPAILPSERQDDEVEDLWTATETYANHYYPTDITDDTDDEDIDNYIALAESDASVGSVVYSAAQASAENVTAFDTSEYVPQVDVTGTGEYFLDDYYGYTDYHYAAEATGDYTVFGNPSMPTVSSGELRGNMYFVVYFNMTGYGTFTPGDFSANVSGSSVTYVYDGYAGYDTVVALESRTSSTYYDWVYLPGKAANDLYTCTKAAPVNSTQTLSAKIHGVYGTPSGPGMQDSGASVSAWYSIHAIPGP